MKDLLVFSGNSYIKLAKNISKKLQINLEMMKYLNFLMEKLI